MKKIKIGKWWLCLENLKELVGILEVQETSDRNINQEAVYMGETGTFTIKFDKEGDSELIDFKKS